MSDRWVRSRAADFCAQHAGNKVRALGASVPIGLPGVRRARDTVPTILAAERRILRHLLHTVGPAEVLELFGVAPQLAPWMAVLTDPDADCQPILRADLLPDRSGNTWICEINVDSSVGAAETAELYRLEELALGRTPQPTPYEHLATMLGPILAELDASKVCLLDWSSWADYGMYDLEWMRQVLAARLPGIRVFVATERDQLADIDEHTVVYRVFMAEDALTDVDFVAKLFDRAGRVITDFSGELLGSKVWLALLHDQAYHPKLDSAMIAAINATVPYAVRITEDNLDRLLSDRADLFFKTACGYGGRGVVSGRTTSADELRSVLGDPRQRQWIAQRTVALAPLLIQPPGSSQLVSVPCVLGWYRFGRDWTGILVRGQTHSEVINAAGGATLGWGREVNG